MTEEQVRIFDKAFHHIEGLAPDNSAIQKRKKIVNPESPDARVSYLNELRKADKLASKYKDDLTDAIDKSAGNRYAAPFKKDFGDKR